MQNFIIKELVVSDIEAELVKIGFDIAYRAKAAEKFKYKTFKIFSLSLPQANILKQTALSFGADCAVHREVLVNSVDNTNAILGGSYSQLKKICNKLKLQPFNMKILADEILSKLNFALMETKLVGVLNLTPDSFSDGGKYFSPDAALNQFVQLVEDGADVIDIGAESTRPGAIDVEPFEQIKRLKLVLENIPDIRIPISVDTRSSEVARYALDSGASIINDVSGMTYDAKIADVVASYDATLILQHSTLNAKDRPAYDDVVEEVYLSLLNKKIKAQEKGVKKLILDVGIGFGKSKENNFELLNRIEEFHTLGSPLMVGVSRKSFLGDFNDIDSLDAMSLACSYPLMQKGVEYLRVHNVKLHRQLLDSVIL